MIIIDKLRYQKLITTIFFDIDGTITRWKSVEEFLRTSLNQLGMPYKDEYLPLLFKAMNMNDNHTLLTGEMDEDMYAYLLGSYITDLREYGLTGKDLKNKMFELEAEQTFIDDDVIDELVRLHKEYKLYCYTNWFRKQALKKLEHHDLTKYFLNVHTPEDVFLKHNFLAYQYLLSKYKLKPQETLFVGDSRTDIIPSKQAGMNTIYLNYDIKCEDDITKNHMEIIQASDAAITNFSDIHVVLSKRY